jgi:probable biosynthetic protein (TIGR04099 family)
MNSPFRLADVNRILSGRAAPPASSFALPAAPPALQATLPALPAKIVLGMPHLCLAGLSETWVLKECGHRHWFLLAEAAGMTVPDFRDAAGAPIYAAFVAVTLRETAFDTVREHDELAFSSCLGRVSRTRFASVHRLTVRGRPVGEVMLTSVFVKRTEARRNRSIVRVEVPGLPPLAATPANAPVVFPPEIAALRHDAWTEHLGFRRDSVGTGERLVIDPCPAQDFNGADFLYFASFQAFVDRAEWAFFRPLDPAPALRRRDIVYFGNIEPGERVAVMLRGHRRDDAALDHWCRIEREHDGAPLADVFTLRGG